MELGLDGKVALVAGASRGIGKAIAMSLARESARVAICARDEASLEAARSELAASGADIFAVTGDLAQPEAASRIVNATVARFGALHVLVNNAGGPPSGRFDDLADSQWQAAFELTLMSAVRLTRATLPIMRAQKWGRIINISSYSTKHPIDNLLLSNSIRLAVAGWAKSLADELAPDNILVNTVAPGWTKTQRITDVIRARSKSGATTVDEIENNITKMIPLRRMARPEEIADLTVFLASERASYITGTLIPVDGGAIRVPI